MLLRYVFSVLYLLRVRLLVHTYVHTVCAFVGTYVHVSTCVHVRMYCVYVCWYKHVRTVCMFVGAYICICTVCTFVCTYIRIYNIIRICTYSTFMWVCMMFM